MAAVAVLMVAFVAMRLHTAGNEATAALTGDLAGRNEQSRRPVD